MNLDLILFKGGMLGQSEDEAEVTLREFSRHLRKGGKAYFMQNYMYSKDNPPEKAFVDYFKGVNSTDYSVVNRLPGLGGQTFPLKSIQDSKFVELNRSKFCKGIGNFSHAVRTAAKAGLIPRLLFTQTAFGISF